MGIPGGRRIGVGAGVKLWAEEAGDGRPVVLVPGAGGEHATWDALWPVLTGQNRCVRYDLRGCGASEDGTAGAFRHADDLAAVLDGFGIARTTVVGVSMGGRIAVDFALANPGRVARLVLISPGLAGWEWSAPWRERWQELSAAAQGGDLRRVRDLWFHHPLFATTRRTPEAAARLRAAVERDACRVWLDADREIPPPRPHVECLGDLGMPVLLLTGAEDLEDFRVVAEVVAAMAADVRRVDVPGAGHLVHEERPVETADAVAAFLA